MGSGDEAPNGEQRQGLVRESKAFAAFLSQLKRFAEQTENPNVTSTKGTMDPKGARLLTYSTIGLR